MMRNSLVVQAITEA